MTNEQRAAVALLAEGIADSRLGRRFTRDENRALCVLLDMLTPPDPAHRIVVLNVEPPRCSDECGGCGLYLSCEWQCREWRNEWSYRGDQMVEVAVEVPGDGCPFKEQP
jgi:hypothetical protein